MHICDEQLVKSVNDYHLMDLLVKPNKHALPLILPNVFQLLQMINLEKNNVFFSSDKMAIKYFSKFVIAYKTSKDQLVGEEAFWHVAHGDHLSVSDYYLPLEYSYHRKIVDFACSPHTKLIK